MFKKLKARFGGGTTLDTIVHTPVTRPGGRLEGTVEIVGGEFEQEIQYVEMALQGRAEVESDDVEHDSFVRFATQRVHGAFTLHPAEKVSLPFWIGLPLQTPFNVMGHQELHRIQLGLRTELEISRSTDKADLDPIRVAPLPAQERILVALERIGCRFTGSDLEKRRVHGSELPFVQEVEFAPPAELAGALTELEVTFLAGPHAMDVLIEGDRRGGFLDEGGDRTHRLTIGYDAVDRENWEEILRGHLHELGRRRGLFG
jgi:sporulation-control protein